MGYHQENNSDITGDREGKERESLFKEITAKHFTSGDSYGHPGTGSS